MEKGRISGAIHLVFNADQHLFQCLVLSMPGGAAEHFHQQQA